MLNQHFHIWNSEWLKELTSTCSHRLCFSQMLAISSMGSNAPNTVVPAVALTKNGTAPWTNTCMHTDFLPVTIWTEFFITIPSNEFDSSPHFLPDESFLPEQRESSFPWNHETMNLLYVLKTIKINVRLHNFFHQAVLKKEVYFYIKQVARNCFQLAFSIHVELKCLYFA